MIVARLATAATADSQAVGAGTGREGKKGRRWGGVQRWWGGRVGGGCYIFVGKVLIFAETETNTERPAGLVGVGVGGSGDWLLSIPWARISSVLMHRRLTAMSVKLLYLSQWRAFTHQQRQTAGTSTELLVLYLNSEQLSERRLMQGGCMGDARARYQEHLCGLCWNVRPDLQT